MSKYQILIADFHNFSTDNVKNIVQKNLFNKETFVLHYEVLQLYVRLKKTRRLLEFNRSQWRKEYIKFSTRKRIEAEKTKKKMENQC